MDAYVVVCVSVVVVLASCYHSWSCYRLLATLLATSISLSNENIHYLAVASWLILIEAIC